MPGACLPVMQAQPVCVQTHGPWVGLTDATPPSRPTCRRPACIHSRSVVFDSLRPLGLLSTMLLCPWDSPGKDAGAGCHALLQGIFPAQGLNLCLFHLLYGRRVLYPSTNCERHRDMTLLSQRYDPLPQPAVSESSPPGVLQTLRTRQGGHLEGAGRVPGGDKEGRRLGKLSGGPGAHGGLQLSTLRRGRGCPGTGPLGQERWPRNVCPAVCCSRSATRLETVLGPKGNEFSHFHSPKKKKKYWCDDYQEAGCAESWLLSLPSVPTTVECLQHRLPCRRRSRPGRPLFLSLPFSSFSPRLSSSPFTSLAMFGVLVLQGGPRMG